MTVVWLSGILANTLTGLQDELSQVTVRLGPDRHLENAHSLKRSSSLPLRNLSPMQQYPLKWSTPKIVDVEHLSYEVSSRDLEQKRSF